MDLLVMDRGALLLEDKMDLHFDFEDALEPETPADGTFFFST